MKPQFVLLAAFFLVGWHLQAEAAEPPRYSQDIKPLMTRYCVQCHNSTRARGEVDLSSLDAIMKGGKNGPAVVAGNADQSPLVQTMEGNKRPMPPRKSPRKPTEKEIALVRAWVAAGAKDRDENKDKPE